MKPVQIPLGPGTGTGIKADSDLGTIAVASGNSIKLGSSILLKRGRVLMVLVANPERLHSQRSREQPY